MNHLRSISGGNVTAHRCFQASRNTLSKASRSKFSITQPIYAQTTQKYALCSSPPSTSSLHPQRRPPPHKSPLIIPSTTLFTSTRPLQRRDTWTSESLSIPSANQYPVYTITPQEVTHVSGEPFALFLDLSRVGVGDHFVVPHEFTLFESDRVLFQANSYEFNRIYTSAPFAQRVGLDAIPMPFYMLLSYAASMSHVDSSKNVLDVGYANAVYVRPVYAGTTLRKEYFIRAMRRTRDPTAKGRKRGSGQEAARGREGEGERAHTSTAAGDTGPPAEGEAVVVVIACQLYDVHTQELVFSLDKTMLVPASAPQMPQASRIHSEDKAYAPASTVPESKYRETIVDHASCVTFHKSRRLTPRQLLLHTPVVPITHAGHLQHCHHVRLSHPLHTNYERHLPANIVVSGAEMVIAAVGASNRALFEVLWESVDECVFVNRLQPDAPVGAITFIHKVTELPPKPCPVKTKSRFTRPNPNASSEMQGRESEDGNPGNFEFSGECRYNQSYYGDAFDHGHHRNGAGGAGATGGYGGGGSAGGGSMAASGRSSTPPYTADMHRYTGVDMTSRNTGMGAGSAASSGSSGAWQTMTASDNKDKREAGNMGRSSADMHTTTAGMGTDSNRGNSYSKNSSNFGNSGSTGSGLMMTKTSMTSGGSGSARLPHIPPHGTIAPVTDMGMVGMVGWSQDDHPRGYATSTTSPGRTTVNGYDYEYTCEIDPHANGGGASGALAEVVATTVGIKDLDVVRDLTGYKLPVKLFERGLLPNQIIAMVAEEAPILNGRITCVVHRTLLRQSLYARQDLMPLL